MSASLTNFDALVSAYLHRSRSNFWFVAKIINIPLVVGLAAFALIEPRMAALLALLFVPASVLGFGLYGAIAWLSVRRAQSLLDASRHVAWFYLEQDLTQRLPRHTLRFTFQDGGKADVVVPLDESAIAVELAKARFPQAQFGMQN